MIHTASLLHDDVIDMADTRRGMNSVNFVFGNKLAILAGDFLLARASVSLARLRNLDVRVVTRWRVSSVCCAGPGGHWSPLSRAILLAVTFWSPGWLLEWIHSLID
jgi:hypothetical protein